MPSSVPSEDYVGWNSVSIYIHVQSEDSTINVLILSAWHISIPWLSHFWLLLFQMCTLWAKQEKLCCSVCHLHEAGSNLQWCFDSESLETSLSGDKWWKRDSCRPHNMDSRAHKSAVLHAIFTYASKGLYEWRNCCVVLNILLQGLVMLFFSFFGRWLTETYRCLSSVEFVPVPVCFNATKTYWDNVLNLVFAFWPVRSLSSSKMTCASQVGFGVIAKLAVCCVEAYEKLHTLLHLFLTVVVSHSSYSRLNSHSGKPSCNQIQKGIAKARCSQQISFWIWNLRTRSPYPVSLYNLKPRRTTAWSPPPQVRSAWMIQTDILTCCQWRTALFEESQQDNRFTFTWT